MDTNAFLEEFKRLTIENHQLKQEIKQVRITKNLEIDEVEALCNKTKEELAAVTKELKEIKENNNKKYLLTEYKGLILAESLIEIIDFKSTSEFKEFKNDFYKLAVPYFDQFYSKQLEFEIDKKSITSYYKFKDKYKNILEKYKFINKIFKYYEKEHPEIITLSSVDYNQARIKKSYAPLIILKFILDNKTVFDV
jgi:hypothetical protein